MKTWGTFTGYVSTPDHFAVLEIQVYRDLIRVFKELKRFKGYRLSAEQQQMLTDEIRRCGEYIDKNSRIHLPNYLVNTNGAIEAA